MPKNNENFNKELEGFLRAQGIKKIATLDANGEAVPDSKHADQFKFHYRNGEFDYGTVTVTTDEGKVTVYFNESVVRDPERGIDTNWTKFLMKLKDWSLRNGQMGFQVRNLDELGNQMRKRQIQKEEENLLEGYYGTKHTSYNDNNPKIKMIIKHNKALDENDQRFRYIDKIFLENEVGERLLVPTKKPSVGRAFARHLAEGGEYNDDRWKHIYEISEDLNKLNGFVRATKTNQFNESVMQIVNEATEHYIKLKETLHKIQGSRGYHQYFESYKPSIMENDVEHDYSNMFTTNRLDPRIESAFSVLSKLNIRSNELSEANEFEDWANSIVEGRSPELDKKIEDLLKILNNSEKVAVGADAMNIKGQLDDIFDDDSDKDQLYSELEKVAHADPDHDAKPVIVAWLQERSDDKFYGDVLDKMETSTAPVAPETEPEIATNPSQGKSEKPAAPGGADGAPGPSPQDAKAAQQFMPQPLAEKAKKPVQRNFVAKNAQRSGAGAHGKKGFQRHDKHKRKLGEEGVTEARIDEFYDEKSDKPEGGKLDRLVRRSLANKIPVFVLFDNKTTKSGYVQFEHPVKGFLVIGSGRKTYTTFNDETQKATKDGNRVYIQPRSMWNASRELDLDEGVAETFYKNPDGSIRVVDHKKESKELNVGDTFEYGFLGNKKGTGTVVKLQGLPGKEVIIGKTTDGKLGKFPYRGAMPKNGFYIKKIKSNNIDENQPFSIVNNKPDQDNMINVGYDTNTGEPIRRPGPPRVSTSWRISQEGREFLKQAYKDIKDAFKSGGESEADSIAKAYSDAQMEKFPSGSNYDPSSDHFTLDIRRIYDKVKDEHKRDEYNRYDQVAASSGPLIIGGNEEDDQEDISELLAKYKENWKLVFKFFSSTEGREFIRSELKKSKIFSGWRVSEILRYIKDCIVAGVELDRDSWKQNQIKENINTGSKPSAASFFVKVLQKATQQGVAEGYSELDNLKAKFEERVASIIARAKAEGRGLDQLTDREKKAIAILKGKDQGVAEGSLNEFATGSGGGGDDILKTLAAQWLNGDVSSGDLDSDIQSQEKVERRLEKGVTCPDGVKRKLYIDYSDDYEGVVIYGDDDWSITYKQDDLHESKNDESLNAIKRLSGLK